MAHSEQRVVSARDIAEKYDVPLPLLMNVLKKLNRTGIVNSVRGARGGYILAAPPEEITLTALIEAVEGPVHLTRCTNPRQDGRTCNLMKTCPVRGALGKVHRELRSFLSRVTLADVAREGHAPQQDDQAKVLAE